MKLYDARKSPLNPNILFGFALRATARRYTVSLIFIVKSEEIFCIGKEKKKTKMASILVTGGAGFIGSHVVDALCSKKASGEEGKGIGKIVVGDCFDCCASEKNVSEKDVIVEAVDIRNLSDVEQLLEKHEIDTIIHLAAQSHVENSFGNSLSFTDVNVTGTHVLLEAFRKRWEEKGKQESWRFVHISTDEVYGSTDDTHKEDVSLLQPTNPYAASKAAAEMMVQSYCRSFLLPTIITRSNNVYGPRQYPEKVIPKFILRLLHGEKPRLQGSGLQKRSFLYATDVAEAILQVFLKGQVGRIYNIGSEDEFSIAHVATVLTKMVLGEDKSDFVSDKDRPFNDHRYSLDTSRLKEELGWKQTISFEEGLRRTIEWYKSIGEGEYWHTLPADLHDQMIDKEGDVGSTLEDSKSRTYGKKSAEGEERKEEKKEGNGEKKIAVCIHLWNKDQLQEMVQNTKNVADFCKRPSSASSSSSSSSSSSKSRTTLSKSSNYLFSDRRYRENTVKQTNSLKQQIIVTPLPHSLEIVLIAISEKDATEKEIERIKAPFIEFCGNVVIIPAQNRGFDIGGFLLQCGYLLDKKLQIDYILKLHTKSSPPLRKSMIAPLCGTADSVARCCSLLQQENFEGNGPVGEVGGARFVIVDTPFIAARNKYHLEDLSKLIFTGNKKFDTKNAKFVAGTMFWYRWSLLQRLFQDHIAPCMLRKLLNDETSLDYHWYRFPAENLVGRRVFYAADKGGEEITSAEQSVRHFEAVGNKNKVPGSITHTHFESKNIPWEKRLRDGEVAHSVERMLGYWVQYCGFQIAKA